MIRLTDDQIKQISERLAPEDLPGDLAEVADFIGVYSSLLLVSKLGGVTVYMKKWNDDETLWSNEIRLWVDVIGANDTAIISRLFDGNYIIIPKCEAIFKRYRDELIQEHSASKTSAYLARVHSLSDRQIKRIKKAVKDDRQSNLF